VEPEDGKALANALWELKRDGACREQMGRNGRTAAEARFATERVVSQYEELLSEVAGGGRTSP
jgi:glycosyltransferase involved in cell wall biosynthesis